MIPIPEFIPNCRVRLERRSDDRTGLGGTKREFTPLPGGGSVPALLRSQTEKVFTGEEIGLVQDDTCRLPSRWAGALEPGDRIVRLGAVEVPYTVGATPDLLAIGRVGWQVDVTRQEVTRRAGGQ